MKTSVKKPEETVAAPVDLRRDVKASLLLSAIIVAATVGIEMTSVGEELEIAAYNVLQGRLGSSDVPVTIVDISPLRARPDVATPRDTLRAALDAIADQHPRAVGIDIDFSPDEHGYLHPRDPEFFQFCLDLRARKGVPVFLGIGRSVVKPPAQWLGSERYQSLAGHILVPVEHRRMISAVVVGSRPDFLPARAISTLLAEAYGPAPPQFRGAKTLEQLRIIENVHTTLLSDGISLRELWVDYGPIASIRTIRTTNAVVLSDGSQSDAFEDRIVLLGDASPTAQDHFSVGGHDYAGVYLHACAVYTLLRGPLYGVTSLGRIVIDTLCILTVLMLVTSIRWWYRKRAKVRVAVHRVQIILTFLLLLIPFTVGVLLIRRTRLMWTDFILTAIALLLHPSLEPRLERLGARLKGAFAEIWRRAFFEKGEEP